MEVYERKIGRVYRLEFKEGDNLLAEISSFVQKEGIREASLSILGAIGEGKIVTGFRSEKEGSSALRGLGRKREFFGVGSLTWPAKPPSSAIREGIPWDKPRPHPHLHLSFGGCGRGAEGNPCGPSGQRDCRRIDYHSFVRTSFLGRGQA